MSIEHDRAAASYMAPFQPLPRTGAGTDTQLSLDMAHATAYSAAQLGVIAQAVVGIEKHLAAIAAHFPEPGSVEDVVKNLSRPKKP